MKSKWIIGAGDHLDLVLQAAWQLDPQTPVSRVDVPQGADYEFDLSVLASLDPEQGTAFVAFDERFGNFKRMELFQAALERGLKLEPLIHPSAVVAQSATIGPNVYIGPNAVIGHGCRIDYNTVIHAGAHLGAHTHVRSSCWVENGVQIGDRVELGAHVIVRMGASVRKGVKVGRGAELGWPQLYHQDVADKTVYDVRYDEPIYVYGR